MRVMHLVHTPRFSGAETLVLALTKLHTEWGHASAVAAMAPAEKDFEPMLVEQVALGIQWFCPADKLGRLGRLAHFRASVKAFKPDVIFAHSVLPAAFGRIAGLSPIISVLHDANENDYAGASLAWSERILQYLSAGVIAVSPRAAERYKAQFKHPEVCCIPNGIDLAAYQQYDSSARESLIRELGLPADALLVVQVGRVTAIKQQHLSVRAMQAPVKGCPKIHFLVAGIMEDDTSIQRMHSEIARAGLAKHVHLLGPRKDVPRLLSAADLYLMPSAQEAHSVAMIEALASGVSVVASKIPPFEYTSQYQGVSLIDPENTTNFSAAIVRALKIRERFSRDLSSLDIRTTATRYIQFAEKLN